MRLGIVGSRTFDNYTLLTKVLEKYFILWDVTTIVSGGAKGADTLAEKFARNYDKEMIVFPAEWKKFGKGAGFKRNHTIWQNSDVVVAFWDGKSTGTKHSFELCRQYKKDFLVIEYTNKKLYWYRPEDEEIPNPLDAFM